MKIVTYAEALRRGLTSFYDGVPCRHGHYSARNTKTGRCNECSNASERVRRARDRPVRGEYDEHGSFVPAEFLAIKGPKK